MGIEGQQCSLINVVLCTEAYNLLLTGSFQLHFEVK